jgi:hypothetical protein
MEYTYEFFFENGRKETFTLSLNDETLLLDPLPVESEEEWMALDFNRCSVCTLDPSHHKHCPVAHNLSHVLSHFRNDISHETVTTRVTFSERITEKNGPLEACVSSLMGLIMATSGCPVLDVLRPMAYTHLPFSNEKETTFRAVCAYLTAQAIRKSQGLDPEWDINNVAGIYTGISKLNADFTERMRSLNSQDAILNAVITLDIFAQLSSFALPGDWVNEVKGVFTAYLKNDVGG